MLVDTRLETTFCREPVQSGNPKPGFLSREKVFSNSVGKGIGVAPGIAEGQDVGVRQPVILDLWVKDFSAPAQNQLLLGVRHEENCSLSQSVVSL